MMRLSNCERSVSSFTLSSVASKGTSTFSLPWSSRSTFALAGAFLAASAFFAGGGSSAVSTDDSQAMLRRCFKQ